MNDVTRRSHREPREKVFAFRADGHEHLLADAVFDRHATAGASTICAMDSTWRAWDPSARRAASVPSRPTAKGGVTVAEVARRFKINEPTLSRWLRASRGFELAVALGPYDLGAASEHVVRRDIADRAVQSHPVVVPD